MTQAEFDEWIALHCSAFGSGLAERLEQQGGAMMRLWFRVLCDLPFAAAKDATETMLRDAGLQPRSWAGHPSVIRQLARQEPSEADARPISGRWRDGRWLYDCPICEDLGQLVIVHRSIVSRAADDPDALAGAELRTAAVLCTCQAAERFRRNRKPTARYDPARDVLVAASDRGTLERVHKRAAELRASRSEREMAMFE